MPSTPVYLDTSIYNRPFDDQAQPRIWLETLAISIILQMIEDNTVTLISSTVVAYENSRNPQEARRAWVQKVMNFAAFSQIVNENIKQRAEALEKSGLKALDALHVACAETTQVNYFITCDDRLIRRYRASSNQKLIVCTPTEFIESISEV